MSFVVTDGAGKSIVDIKIDVEGESDGPPNEALKQAMKRFLDAAALIARPFEQLEQGSAASPATQR